MEQKAIEEQCTVCGSWGFQRREDGEFYCNSCSMPLVKKAEKPEPDIEIEK